MIERTNWQERENEAIRKANARMAALESPFCRVGARLTAQGVEITIQRKGWGGWRTSYEIVPF